MSASSFSAQKVVLDLLRYIGVTGFTAPLNDQALNQPGIDTDDVNRAVIAVNSALQTIQKHGPDDLKFGRRSAYYGAPATLSLTINVVTNPKLATAAVAPYVNLIGCSVIIDGDGDLNRITNISGTAVSFLRAYLGSSAAGIGATVYSDCATLGDDVAAVSEPVLATPNLRLWPAKDLDEFERLRNRSWCSAWPNGYGGGVEAITTTLGVPERYLVERQRSGIPLLRVTPMPITAINVTFKAELRAERISSGATYLDQTGATDPNYIFTSLHDDELESILLPIARMRFFVHPALKNSESRAAVEKEYTEVMSMLNNGGLLQSSKHAERVTYL